MAGYDAWEPSAEVSEEIRRQADYLLKKAGAYGILPTTTPAILHAAGLKLSYALFTDDAVLRQMDETPIGLVKRAKEALLGVVDIRGGIVYVRPPGSFGDSRALIFHETGHAFLNWQRDSYLFVEEGKGVLEPDIRDEFEREATRFASELIFQLDRFRHDAEREEFSLRTPVKLATLYGTTNYAAMRRFAETNRRPCALLIWSRTGKPGERIWLPRQPIQSPSFTERFGLVEWEAILDRGLCGLLMNEHYGHRTPFRLPDLGGKSVSCEAQGFSLDNHHYLLAYPEPIISSVRMLKYQV